MGKLIGFAPGAYTSFRPINVTKSTTVEGEPLGACARGNHVGVIPQGAEFLCETLICVGEDWIRGFVPEFKGWITLQAKGKACIDAVPLSEFYPLNQTQNWQSS